MRGTAQSIGIALATLALVACASSASTRSERTTGAETPEAMDAAVAAPPEPPPSDTPPPEPPPPETPRDTGPPDTGPPDAGPPPAPARTDLPSVGPALAAPDATDTEVDAAWNSFLTNQPRPDCAIDTPLSWIHEGCRALRPTRVSTSAADATTLPRAFDLDACTMFSAGDGPQTIEIELARMETIDLLVIDPGPHSSGPSRHVIETEDARGRWVPRTVLFGAYYDSVLYALRFPSPIRARRLRVRTIASPGPIEHREIVPIACRGDVAIHVEGIAPDPEPSSPPIDWHAPEYTHVTGSGHCRSDRDCAPVACCGGSQCGLARDAPNCSGVGCGQGCGSPLDCGHGACICFHGTCSLATTYPMSDAVDP